jgi:hypothetical protein
MNAEKRSHERAFMLRCWFEDERSGWRFILEPIGQDRQRVGFTSLEELSSFLAWSLDCRSGEESVTGVKE